MTTPAPVTRQVSDDWDTMLAGLAIDRVRRLLGDAMGILDQVVPPPDTALDTELRRLRRALSHLGIRP
jgi:hypothetical protein